MLGDDVRPSSPISELMSLWPIGFLLDDDRADAPSPVLAFVDGESAARAGLDYAQPYRAFSTVPELPWHSQSGFGEKQRPASLRFGQRLLKLAGYSRHQ